MSWVRWVAWDKFCATWVVWDRSCVTLSCVRLVELSEMSWVRWVEWDEWGDLKSVRCRQWVVPAREMQLVWAWVVEPAQREHGVRWVESKRRQLCESQIACRCRCKCRSSWAPDDEFAVRWAWMRCQLSAQMSIMKMSEISLCAIRVCVGWVVWGELLCEMSLCEMSLSEMSCVRWVEWVRWVAWDEFVRDDFCEMICVRWVDWDELCEMSCAWDEFCVSMSCVRWVVWDELSEIEFVWAEFVWDEVCEMSLCELSLCEYEFVWDEFVWVELCERRATEEGTAEAGCRTKEKTVMWGKNDRRMKKYEKVANIPVVSEHFPINKPPFNEDLTYLRVAIVQLLYLQQQACGLHLDKKISIHNSLATCCL